MKVSIVYSITFMCIFLGFMTVHYYPTHQTEKLVLFGLGIFFFGMGIGGSFANWIWKTAIEAYKVTQELLNR